MHVDTVFVVCPLIFAAMWTAVQAVSPVPSVPANVRALAGSCVVIPCSFTPLAPHPLKGRKERVDVQLSFRGGNSFFPLRSIAFTSEGKGQVSRVFQGRTSQFGRSADGDCSVKIERITENDARMFEIALKRGDDLLWGRPMSFNLHVVDSPEAPAISGTLAATEGQLVTLNCSVSYYCPSRPPALQWTWERGTQPNGTKPGEVQLLHPEPHRLMLLAPLSFTVSHKVKPRLRCEVSYPGAKALTTSKELHVTFSPKDVVVIVHTLMVQEGSSALLGCSCKADPPASGYHWSYTQNGHTVHLRQRTHTIRVFNVTRGMTVRCSAENLIGRGESRPTLLNIHYKPLILQLSSTCDVDDTMVFCHCSVDSNPKAAITWSVNGSVPPHDYNTSVTSKPDKLTATLRGRMDTPQTVICFAVNALGNDSLTLLQGGEDTTFLLWMVVPAVAICLGLFLLSLILCCCCCHKRAAKQALSRQPAVYHEDMGVYQDQMPLYINCTEVTHIYTNGSYQLVYQNCTPVFVRTKQVRPMGRRGGERRRGGQGGGTHRRGGLGIERSREVQSAAASSDAETAIYLEIL